MIVVAQVLDCGTIAAPPGGPVGPSLMERVPLGFTDHDPNRARLHRQLTASVNQLVGVTVRVKAPPTADTEFIVRHTPLRNSAQEVHVLLTDRPASVYASSHGRWTKTETYLKCTAADAALTLRLR